MKKTVQEIDSFDDIVEVTWLLLDNDCVYFEQFVEAMAFFLMRVIKEP
ncbi:hypothetical protein [Nostoc sp.]